MRRYPFGRFVLDVPDDHRIRDIHKVDVLYDRAFGFIVEEIARTRPAGVFIDIGANIGDTAAILATYADNNIVSFEGNGNFLGYFKSNLKALAPQVRLVEKYVRPAALEELAFKYEEITGTGEIHVATDKQSALPEQVFVAMDQLASAAGVDPRSVSLVKSDTDGFDGYIVRELLDMFDSPLFFECDTNTILDGIESPWPEVFSKLDERGYAVAIFDNHGLPMLTADSNVGSILRDLSGYTHLQRSVHPVRVHYLDVWAFPRNWSDTANSVFKRLRSDFLKPYRF